MVLHGNDESRPESAKIGAYLDLLRKSNKNAPSLRELLEDAATEATNRFDGFSQQAGSLLLDFSRTSLTEQSLDLLLDLAAARGVEESRQRMFAGDPLNRTEGRAVLHHLWRSGNFQDCLGTGEARDMAAANERMNRLSEPLSCGHLPGSAHRRISDLVHVGIGGSLLGPRLLCEALPRIAGSPCIHFLSAPDANTRDALLSRLDPEQTAFVFVSKSFTTSEILLHGRRILEWMAPLDGLERSARMFAVTSSPERAEAFGVPAAHVMAMGEWTGGRYSLWSTVGFTAQVAVGATAFDALRRGGSSMDEHFRSAPMARNLPILMGLLRIWHRNVLELPTQGCIPYDSRLRSLPAWLQQLEMESNGKSVDLQGGPVDFDTSAVVVGDCGTDCQHSLFQMFHQGTQPVPLDFIAAIDPDHGDEESHRHLLANMLAQATALATGRSADEVARSLSRTGLDSGALEQAVPHRAMPGNRPSSILLLDRLDAESLGALLTLYEHAVFVSSVIWDINAFDQWGVEMGKRLAGEIEPMLAGSAGETADPPLAALNGIISYIRQRS